MRPEQNGCYFTDDIFKYIFLNENTCILYDISNKQQAITWTNVDHVLWLHIVIKLQWVTKAFAELLKHKLAFTIFHLKHDFPF